MPLPTEMELPKTKDAAEFEDIVCDICMKRFNIEFQRYGRSGQSQSGVDIISVDKKKPICVQCKNYKIPLKQIDDIINKVKCFDIPISKFIIATSSFRDTKLQKYILEINQRDDLDFVVCIMFWEEISKIVFEHKDLLSKYYLITNINSIDWLVSEFNQLINKYNIFNLLVVDPVEGMHEYYFDQYERFYEELGKKLIQVNTLQKKSKFVAINSFRDEIKAYISYLTLKLFPANNNMFTMQNIFDLRDINNEDSKIRKEIYNYKSELDKLYGQINKGCSMFLVRQYQ